MPDHTRLDYFSDAPLGRGRFEVVPRRDDLTVRDGDVGNTSEYLRDLIRRDQHEQAAQRVRNLITDGLVTGEGRIVTDDLIASRREQALGTDA
jgi:antitoxin ParD1/3/4